MPNDTYATHLHQLASTLRVEAQTASVCKLHGLADELLLASQAAESWSQAAPDDLDYLGTP